MTATDVPTTMRAIVVDHPGPPEVLTIAEAPMPLLINSEVLVKVAAAGINPIDAKTRAGRGAAAAVRWPAILGYDFSGTVAAVPFEAHPLHVGDEVYGMTAMPRSEGSYAQYLSVSSLSVTKKPARLSLVEAAAVPLAAMTAWGMVVDVAQAHPGQRMLIHAGSGGVGHFAVQFARHFGADITATGSAGNLDFLRELGAREVIDYGSTRFEEVAHDMDVVLDLIGNVHDNTGTRSLSTLRKGGLMVNVPTGSWPTVMEEAAAAGVQATHFKLAPDARLLDQIGALIDSGQVRVHVDEVFDWKRAAAAHAALEGGHTRGKIVLAIA
ncbi:NADP-dependent oxidoreductase [Parafrigoribacterium mesophilum]|uniref:NADP-dependent oxidoreductase n=1 Tax=Parafrigoribacterium mesophilum TaxID=433646 RepID=UPI0031FC0D03